MAFRGEQIAVGTSAVELTQFAESDTVSGRSLAITKATVDIFLGATSAVTSSTGALLPTGTPIAMDLDRKDRVWAIAASSGTAHVVETGV
jgi:hypothetical protein